MIDKNQKHYTSVRSFYAIQPFLIALILLLVVVELPSLIIGIFLKEILSAMRFGIFLLLLPYAFVVIAIFRQVGSAEVTIKQNKIIYKDSFLSKAQIADIKNIKSIKLFDRYDPIFNTNETIGFINNQGVNMVSMNTEKFSGENIKDILSVIKEINPQIEINKRIKFYVTKN